MRPLRALAIYIAVVFLGGALLAPWLYGSMQSLAHAFPQAFHGGLPKLADSPFHRYVNRCILILALAGLWPLLRALGAAAWRDVGLPGPSGQGPNFARGLLLGFLSLAIVAALAFAFGARHLNEKFSGGQVIAKMLGAAAAALVVAVPEEILFRGALFGSLRRVFHWKFALVLSSMIYAIAHFLESAQDPPAVVWFSGLELLPRMFANFLNWQQVIPGFFNLTLAGLLLGLAYQRTGNLYFPIGLHAGWIFCIKAYATVTKADPGANDWWWGAGRMAVVNGWLALPVLVVTMMVFAKFLSGRTSNIQHPTSNIR